jgi:hypothetical protein
MSRSGAVKLKKRKDGIVSLEMQNMNYFAGYFSISVSGQKNPFQTALKQRHTLTFGEVPLYCVQCNAFKS